jgi:hypothetical protein
MLRRLAALTALLAAACGGSDAPPTGVDPNVTANVVRCTSSSVAGTGGMSARLLCPVLARNTGEVAPFEGPRGKYVYTSSWNRRSGATCNANNCGNVVYVWNLGGSAPAMVDSLVVDDFSSVNTTGDVQVSDDGTLLVVATEPIGSIVTYSLADPAHPQLVSRYSTPNLANGVHTALLSRVGGKNYVFASVDPRGGQRSRLTIVDLSDPRAPREVWSRQMGNPFVHDVWVHDGYLLTAVWHDGVTVWDIGARGKGSPSAPDSVSNVRTVNGYAHNVWWGRDEGTGSARYMFVGEEGPAAIGASSSGDVHVVDMSDVMQPREVAYYSVRDAGTHNFSVDARNGILYAAYYNAGVRALDIRGDLGTCTTAQRGTAGRCDLAKMGREIGAGLASGSPPVYVWGVEYLNGSLYVSDMPGGLWVLNPATR